MSPKLLEKGSRKSSFGFAMMAVAAAPKFTTATGFYSVR